MEVLRTRKIKVYKIIKKTDYLKNSRERELLKIKSKDEGVLSLIADSRLYPKDYENSHKIKYYFIPMAHQDFFENFKYKMNKLEGFEFNYARKFIFNSIKNHENSYLFLSCLLRENNTYSNYMLEYLHNNLFYDKNVKMEVSDKTINVIDYVLSEKPKDLLSDSLFSLIVNKRNQIYLSNQFRYYE